MAGVLDNKPLVIPAFRRHESSVLTLCTRENMKPATLPTKHQRLLNRFKDAGGVVEFVFFECEKLHEDVCSEVTHCQAILAGMKLIQRRWDKHFEEVAVRSKSKRSDYLQIQFNEDFVKSIRGKRISQVEFLGPRYDFERQGLIVCGKESFLNEFFFYRDPATHENILPKGKINDNELGAGFAYAFSSPPYPVQLESEELGELFEEFLSFVFNGVSEKSIIFEWPTNWCNYFEAGDEWWGSFLWSFATPNSSQILVITASSTD